MENQIKYRIIKSLSQYNEYCNIHESLMLKDEEKHIDEIELLELLIEDFDQRQEKEKNEKLNPVELLRSLLSESNISQTELSKSIDVSKQLISDVLAYRRNISKEVMIKLSRYFSMSVEAFSRNYELKNYKEPNQGKQLGNN